MFKSHVAPIRGVDSWFELPFHHHNKNYLVLVEFSDDDGVPVTYCGYEYELRGIYIDAQVLADEGRFVFVVEISAGDRIDPLDGEEEKIMFELENLISIEDVSFPYTDKTHNMGFIVQLHDGELKVIYGTKEFAVDAIWRIGPNVFFTFQDPAQLNYVRIEDTVL